MDHGAPSSYLRLWAGLPVYAGDGDQVGSVADVRAEPDKDIFDGIVLETRVGQRFVEASAVDEIYERGVVLSLDRSAVESLPAHGDDER